MLAIIGVFMLISLRAAYHIARIAAELRESDLPVRSPDGYTIPIETARRSEELDLAPAGTAERLEALLRRFGLPTQLPERPRKAYLDALRVDKKSLDSRIRYIALRRIGKAETVSLAPAQILPASWGRRQRSGG